MTITTTAYLLQMHYYIVDLAAVPTAVTAAADIDEAV